MIAKTAFFSPVETRTKDDGPEGEGAHGAFGDLLAQALHDPAANAADATPGAKLGKKLGAQAAQVGQVDAMVAKGGTSLPAETALGAAILRRNVEGTGPRTARNDADDGASAAVELAADDTEATAAALPLAPPPAPATDRLVLPAIAFPPRPIALATAAADPTLDTPAPATTASPATTSPTTSPAAAARPAGTSLPAGARTRGANVGTRICSPAEGHRIPAPGDRTLPGALRFRPRGPATPAAPPAPANAAKPARDEAEDASEGLAAPNAAAPTVLGPIPNAAADLARATADVRPGSGRPAPDSKNAAARTSVHSTRMAFPAGAPAPADPGALLPAPAPAPAPEPGDAVSPTAGLPDASLPGASLPDASLPDASLPDASLANGPRADRPAAAPETTPHSAPLRDSPGASAAVAAATAGATAPASPVKARAIGRAVVEGAGATAASAVAGNAGANARAHDGRGRDARERNATSNAASPTPAADLHTARLARDADGPREGTDANASVGHADAAPTIALPLTAAAPSAVEARPVTDQAPSTPSSPLRHEPVAPSVNVVTLAAATRSEVDIPELGRIVIAADRILASSDRRRSRVDLEIHAAEPSTVQLLQEKAPQILREVNQVATIAAVNVHQSKADDPGRSTANGGSGGSAGSATSGHGSRKERNAPAEERAEPNGSAPVATVSGRVRFVL